VGSLIEQTVKLQGGSWPVRDRSLAPATGKNRPKWLEVASTDPGADLCGLNKYFRLKINENRDLSGSKKKAAHENFYFLFFFIQYFNNNHTKKFADLTLLVAPVSRHMQWCGTSAMLNGVSDVENAATPLPLA
jgi:hypothetical protein